MNKRKSTVQVILDKISQVPWLNTERFAHAKYSTGATARWSVC